MFTKRTQNIGSLPRQAVSTIDIIRKWQNVSLTLIHIFNSEKQDNDDDNNDDEF